LFLVAHGTPHEKCVKANGSRWTTLFEDREIKDLLTEKFTSLSKLDLVASSSQLQAATLAVQDNRFPFPHADSLIYKRTMYVASRAGVSAARCDRRTKTKYPVSTLVTKSWDAPVVSIAASYNSLALSALDEGLFEAAIEHGIKSEPLKRSSRHCTACSWNFYGIHGSSHLDGGFLVPFRKQQSDDSGSGLFERKLLLEVPDTEIFEEHGFPGEHRISSVSRRMVSLRSFDTNHG
jgi:hypothetical protein